MKTMKFIFGLTAIIGLFSLSSCDGDDDNSTPAVENTSALCQDGIDNDGDGVSDCEDSDCADFSFCEEIPETETISGSIGTRTLTNDRIWIIDGYTYVGSGDTVTIEPGTIIKAQDGQVLDASAFIVARGGTLIANGTANQPIIFTSINDNIALGETQSSGLSPDDSGAGQWGGLVVLGSAPISAGSSTRTLTEPLGSEASIEGISSTVSYSLYGGNDSGDSSGELSYISIRFTGTQLGAGNEVQGLTLGGVGSGTSISNIEVFSSDDDGIEIFGGTVDVSNLLVAYQTDDAIDIDQSYDGTVDNALVLNYVVDVDDEGPVEIDGREQEGVNDGGSFTLSNATLMNMAGADGFGGQLKSSARGKFENVAFVGFDNAARLFEINSVLAWELDGVAFASSSFTNADSEDVTITDVTYDVTDFSGLGADTSVFGWTFASELGLF